MLFRSPIVITIRLSAALNNLGPAVYSKRAAHNQRQLRWDKADLNSFYSYTYDHLPAVLDHINELASAYECSVLSDRDCCDYIDTVYKEIVYTLNNAAEAYVPKHCKHFFLQILVG